MANLALIMVGAAADADYLHSLQPLRESGAELIVACSSDTVGATGNVDKVVVHAGSIAAQLNAAAVAASSDVLVFVPASSQLPSAAVALITQALAPGNRVWGRFDLRFSGSAQSLRLIERCSNLWTRYMGRASLRHGLFVTRLAFEQAGRFPELPLFTDIAFCRALRQLSRPACIRDQVVIASERMEARGIWRSVFLTAWLRLSYSLGVEPGMLHSFARRYRMLDTVVSAEY